MDREIVGLIKHWNGGVWRGAVTKFAKKIGISTTAVSNWTRGRVRIDEDNIPKVSKELGVPPEQLAAMLGTESKTNHSDHDYMIPLRKEIFDLLTKKKDLAGVTLSTELYIEGLLLGLINTRKKAIRSVGELARGQSGQIQHQETQYVKKRKTA